MRDIKINGVWMNSNMCEACGNKKEFFRHCIMQDKLRTIDLCKECHDDFNRLLKKKLPDKKRDIYSESRLMETFLREKNKEVVIFT